MHKALVGMAAGMLAALTVPAVAAADPLFIPVSGDFNVYYSYARQKVEQATNNPDGSGIGIGGQLNLPLNLPIGVFIDGLYQYNGENQAEFSDPSQPGNTVVGLGLQDQVRAGGGLQFIVPTTPLLLYGKAEYVHYRYESADYIDQFGNIFGFHDNDDGAGYFGGFRLINPRYEIYGQGGYLKLSDTEGPEYRAGIAVPLGRIIRRRAIVQLFAEYDWTRLHELGTSFHDIFYDYRAGIRIPFY